MDEKMEVDYRALEDTMITWKVSIKNLSNLKDTVLLTWDKTTLPKDGYYFINGLNIESLNSLRFYSDTTFNVIYRKDISTSYNIPDISVDEDFQEFQLNLHSYFPFTNPLNLKYSMDNNFIDISLIQDSILKVKSVPDNNGLTEITLINSSSNEEFIQKFKIKVNPVNDKPIFNTKPDSTSIVSNLYTYVFSFSDVDINDSIIVTSVNLPKWLIYDAKTNLIYGTPNLSDIGIYTVEITISDGIVSTMQKFLLEVQNNTSISNESTSKKVCIYPNPAHRSIFITSQDPDFKVCDIVLTSSSGSVIKKWNSVNINLQQSLSIFDVAPGVYNLAVSSDENEVAEKIIIQ
jgi:hypothetical protein